ncbi:MAG: ATP-binding protein [Prevotella sp.]|nr:ATP-binding protein [Prevotella sp.]
MAKKTDLKLGNPFVYQGYVSPEYFCDRTEETEELIANLRNGRNTTLISPRRIGKTGLIRNAFYRIKETDKDAICIYIDIFATKNQHDFVQQLGTAIAQHVMSHQQKALKRLLEFFGSWRPVFSADPLTGMPTVSVSIEPSQSIMTLKGIFDFFEQSRQKVYIAIDEFQQITYYPEQGLEAQLRSYIQFAPNIKFIFSGSKQHLMAQMFQSPDRPFYQSTASMGLAPLHEEIYYDFAKHFFEAKRGSISREVFSATYERFNGITQNLQQILNRLYEVERHVDSEHQVKEAIRHIVNRNSMQYEALVGFLTDNQLSLLKAIAKKDYVASPQANDFIKQYDLPSASSVKTALTVLQDKDLVYRDTKGYWVYDRFFDLWLKQLV